MAAFWYCNNPATCSRMTQLSNSSLNRIHNTSCVSELWGLNTCDQLSVPQADVHFNAFWWDLLFLTSLYSNSMIPDRGSHSPYRKFNMASRQVAFISLLLKSCSWCCSGWFGWCVWFGLWAMWRAILVMRPVSGKNRRLVADEPVEFEI